MGTDLRSYRLVLTTSRRGPVNRSELDDRAWKRAIDALFRRDGSTAHGPETGLRGPEAPLGIGTWIPLVPGRLRRRFEAADALGLVREAVTRIIADWPDPHATEKSRIDGDVVVVWFEDGAGRLTFPEMRLDRVP